MNNVDLSDDEIERRYSFKNRSEEARYYGTNGCVCATCYNKRTHLEWNKIQNNKTYQTFIDYLRHAKETIKIKTLAQNRYGIKFRKNTALCPFHDDKTPSFSVDELDNTFKCWSSSCGKSGDVIEFIEQMERQREHK